MNKKDINFKEHIKEIEDFYKEGLERIKLYYSGRKEKPPLKDSPSKILEKVASQFFREAMNSCLIKNDSDFNNFKDSSVYEICIGCGMEIFMKAAILSKCPEKFIENSEMKYSELKKLFLQLLPVSINTKQRERILDTLRLIQLKRNKWAHLSFHKFSAYYEDYQIFNLLGYFYLTYFPDAKIIEEIKKHKELYRVQSGMDFEDVNFIEND